MAHERVSALVAAPASDYTAEKQQPHPVGKGAYQPPFLMGVEVNEGRGDFLGSECRQEPVKAVSLSLM